MKENQMEQYRTLLTMLPIILLAACKVLAQDTGPAVAPPVVQISLCDAYISLTFRTGLLGFLTSVAIQLWAILLIPLGVRSLIACATLKSKQWPLSTKLLLFGPVFLLLLVLIGVVHYLIYMFTHFCFGDAMFWANEFQPLYFVAGSLFLMQFYLMFFLISFVIIHYKHKQIVENS
jgi:hypothetical protein